MSTTDFKLWCNTMVLWNWYKTSLMHWAASFACEIVGLNTTDIHIYKHTNITNQNKIFISTCIISKYCELQTNTKKTSFFHSPNHKILSLSQLFTLSSYTSSVLSFSIVVLSHANTEYHFDTVKEILTFYLKLYI